MIIVEIAGFLGADPEERFTATGKRVITLRVAARARFAGGRSDRQGGQHGQQGERDDTVWWRVSIWGDRYDKMLPYLKKGSAVIIIGEMGKPEVYVAKDGTTQISLNLTAEIIKFSPFGKPEGGREQQNSYGSPQGQPPTIAQEQYATFGAGAEYEHSFAGDDLPF